MLTYILLMYLLKFAKILFPNQNLRDSVNGHIFSLRKEACIFAPFCQLRVR